MAKPEIGKLAAPFKRLVAYLLDGLIFGLVLGFFVFSLGGIPLTLASDGPRILGSLLLLVYVVVTIALLQQGMTPGKLLVGVKVVKRDGQKAGFWTMLIREGLGKPISSSLFSLGLIWVLIDDENQGWHDKFVNTYVVDAKSGQSAVSAED